MNRRSFFASIAALAAGVLLPLAKARRLIDARFFTRAVVLNESWMARVEPCYVVFAHPDVETDLREMYARWRWVAAWRAYRVARRENVCGYLPPCAVLARFGPQPPSVRAEIGRFDGVRILTRESVAA